VTINKSFEKAPRDFLDLLVATVNGTFDLSGNARLDPKAASDMRHYRQRQQRRRSSKDERKGTISKDI
jgi:hypothetical protein